MPYFQNNHLLKWRSELIVVSMIHAICHVSLDHTFPKVYRGPDRFTPLESGIHNYGVQPGLFSYLWICERPWDQKLSACHCFSVYQKQFCAHYKTPVPSKRAGSIIPKYTRWAIEPFVSWCYKIETLIVYLELHLWKDNLVPEIMRKLFCFKYPFQASILCFQIEVNPDMLLRERFLWDLRGYKSREAWVFLSHSIPTFIFCLSGRAAKVST